MMPPMKQASLGLGASAKHMRKAAFLAEMERVVPWAALVEWVAPYAPEGRSARQATCRVIKQPMAAYRSASALRRPLRSFRAEGDGADALPRRIQQPGGLQRRQHRAATPPRPARRRMGLCRHPVLSLRLPFGEGLPAPASAAHNALGERCCAFRRT